MNVARCTSVLATLLGCLLVLAVGPAQATPGALDPSFGTGGVVTTAIGELAFAGALVLQPDGKIVAAGGSWNVTYRENFALARYTANGSLDPALSGTGIVTTAIGSSDGFATALALQPDGKLVAAGDSWNGTDDDFALARYNANGSLDTTFGTGGTVTTDFRSAVDDAFALVLQPDGKLVAAGHGAFDDFALARYNANGSLDASFGSGGKVTTDFGGGDSANALVLQPDGKLVAAGGGRWNRTDHWDFALARYKANGSLDLGFGTGGKVTTTTIDHMYASALALQPDGKLIAAGSGGIVRYDPDGSLDTTFGSSGKVIDRGSIYAAVLQPDGKLVTAGGYPKFALARYLGSTLTVTKNGPGRGTVTSSPEGIDCGSTCSAPFAAVPVVLTATPAPGSIFTGWSGGGCSGTGTCTAQMGNDRSVTATFTLPPKTLTVAKTGRGLVSSSPAGIYCGSACTHTYPYGSAVTLTAQAASHWRFASWKGACSGTGNCRLKLSANRWVAARFLRLCIVPKVKGKKLRAAKRAIRRAYCSVGRVAWKYARRVPSGRVVSQRPKPKTAHSAHTRVKLVVSRGMRHP